MSDANTIRHWVTELRDHRTRGSARRSLAAAGPNLVSDAVLPLILDNSQPENARWAAIELVGEWKHAPANDVLVAVVRNDLHLRNTAVSALESITGYSIGDDPDAWERALANPDVYEAEVAAFEAEAKAAREEEAAVMAAAEGTEAPTADAEEAGQADALPTG